MDIKTPHITASGNLTWYEYDNLIMQLDYLIKYPIHFSLI